LTWPIVPLAELADGKGALVDGPFGSNLKASEYTDSGVPIIRLQNIRPNFFLSKDIKYVSPDKAAELSRHNYMAGDLVIAKLGDPCGMTCVIPSLGASGIIVADVVRFRGRNIDHRFLSYYLNSPGGQAQFARRAKGATRQRVNLADIKEILVPVPSPEEQVRVVDLLSRAENIVRMRREAEQKAQEFIPALFLDMFGDPATNPRKWKSASLGDLIHAAQDGPHVSPQYTETGIPFLSTRHIKRGSILFEDLKHLSRAEAELQWKKCKPRRGDVLYTKGGTTGLAAAIDFDDEIAVWVHVALLKTNHDHVNHFWLESMLNSEYCYAQSQELTHGIANRDLGLTRMVKIRLYHPPLKLQIDFARFVSNFKLLQIAHEAAKKRAEETLQSLLAEVFGE
jgi:type I restriction enzyme, S subunit